MVFSCAVAEDYDHCTVHGVIITARCDLEHDKVPVFNYVPVVSLLDWLDLDGRFILCARVRKAIRGRLEQALAQIQHSSSILDLQPPRVVLDALFSIADARKTPKARNAFGEAVNDWEQVEAAEGSDPGEAALVKLRLRHKKVHDSICAELTRHRLNGYYFLPKIVDSGDDSGYVVLMREVRHIPRDLALAVSRGLDSAGFATLLEAAPELAGRLSFNKTAFCCAVGVIESPQVEHLLQSFAMLFSRIGVQDHSLEYVERISRTGCEAADDT